MEKRILKKKQKVADLLNEIMELEYRKKLKTAKRIEEVEIDIGTRKEPKMVPAKRMIWTELFFDEDFPNDKKKAFKVERSELVEIDGQKTDHYCKLHFYTVDDI